MATTAAKAEARDETLSFRFENVTYRIAPADEWDLDALEAFEDGKVATFLRSVLGADQWAKFRAKPRKVTDLTALAEAMQKAMGLEGN